ncbi:MAG: DUF6152 family protein [Betaproteobacteria bacterium]
MGRAAALILAVLVAAPAGAHHGWSEYDSNKLLKLTGRVVESGYEHPHGHVRMQAVGNEPGKTWTVILAPPSRMERRGLTKDMLRPGASATVEGYPSRSKPEELRAERIIVDGRTMELR